MFLMPILAVVLFFYTFLPKQLEFILDLQSKKDFNLLFESHWHHLYAYAYNILKDKELAEDCVQNVFVDLCNRIGEVTIAHPKAYLYQSVKYQCAKALIIQKRYTQTDPETLQLIASNAEAELEEQESEILKKLHEQVSLLPAKCQQVFRYSKFDKKSNKEIAEELGVSISTVENHINKALKILRKNMPEQLYLLAFFFI